jgi:Flp pilus assembly protein protease CpaA
MDLINIGIREYVVIGVALFYLIIGSIEDIKTREIMDYSNFSLIALGLILNLLFSLIYNDWMIMVYSVLGFIVFIGIAYLMFYTGQWGGGDSKMIMGFGALFGLNYSTIPFLIVFFIASLFLGSIYGILWIIVLAIKNWNKFIVEFKNKMKPYKKLRNSLIFLSISIIILSFIIKEIFIYGLILAFMILFSFYIWIFVKSIEKGIMQKYLKPGQLTEGDWIVNDLYFNKKLFIKKKKIDINDLNKIYYHVDKSNYSNEYFSIKIKNHFFNKKLIELKENDVINENLKTEDFEFKKGHIISKEDLVIFNQLRKIKIKRKFLFWFINKNIFIPDLKLNDILLSEFTFIDKTFKINYSINQDDLDHFIEQINKKRLLNVKVKTFFSKKEINPLDLKIGSIILNDIETVNYICGPKDLGISREQINLLKRYEDKKLIESVLVKEGVPFVPSFLIAFIFCLIFYNSIVFFF